MQHTAVLCLDPDTNRWLWKLVRRRGASVDELVSEWVEIAVEACSLWLGDRPTQALRPEDPVSYTRTEVQQLALAEGRMIARPVTLELSVLAERYAPRLAVALGLTIDELFSDWATNGITAAARTLTRQEQAAEAAAEAAEEEPPARSEPTWPPGVAAGLAAMRDVLADGKWHSYQEIRETLAPLGLPQRRVDDLIASAATMSPPLIKRRRRHARGECLKLTDIGWPVVQLDTEPYDDERPGIVDLD